MSSSQNPENPNESQEADHAVSDEVLDAALDGLLSSELGKEFTDVEERPDRQIYQIRMMWAFGEVSRKSLGDYFDFDLPKNAVSLIVTGEVRQDVPGPRTRGTMWFNRSPREAQKRLLTLKAVLALVEAMLEE